MEAGVHQRYTITSYGFMHWAGAHWRCWVKVHGSPVEARAHWKCWIQVQRSWIEAGVPWRCWRKMHGLWIEALHHCRCWTKMFASWIKAEDHSTCWIKMHRSCIEAPGRWRSQFSILNHQYNAWFTHGGTHGLNTSNINSQLSICCMVHAWKRPWIDDIQLYCMIHGLIDAPIQFSNLKYQ